MKRLRVSCAAFCRIEHEGRYLFVLNETRARAGRLEVTPVGGSLEHYDPPILRQIDAQPEDGAAHELRFCLEGDGAEARLRAFRNWFARRVQREVDPFREMQEELVDEQGILSDLSRRDVRLRLTDIVEHQQPTDRPGACRAKTRYFWEVFDVDVLNPAVMRDLLRSDRRRGAFWLTLDEAERGTPILWRNVAISPCLAHLLHNGHKPGRE